MNPAESLAIEARGDREIVITREFRAPPGRVFEAMTHPDLIRRWLTGPAGWTMTECACDLRVGGTYRHVWRGPDGQSMAMSGTFREIVRPERIVRTERFEYGCEPQAGEQIGTLALTGIRRGVGTAVRITVLFPSREARDATLGSGMERGVAAGYGHLDEILARPRRLERRTSERS